MTSGNEFENIIQRMAQNKQSNVAPQSAAIKLLSVLAAFSTISFFGGFIIMVANTIVNDAYSNLDALRCFSSSQQFSAPSKTRKIILKPRLQNRFNPDTVLPSRQLTLLEEYPWVIATSRKSCATYCLPLKMRKTQNGKPNSARSGSGAR